VKTVFSMSEQKKKVPVLHRASSRGDSGKIKAILEKSSNVNQKAGPFDETSLHVASGQGHADVVEVLLEAGANVNVFDSFERTPAMLAAKNGHYQALELLMKAVTKEEEDEEEADKAMRKTLDQRDLTGKNVFHFAAEGGSMQCIELLLQLGADMQATEENGRTPLHLASAKGHTDLVEFFIESGAEMNAKDSKHHTPLYHAGYRNHRATQLSVMNRGVSPRVRLKKTASIQEGGNEQEEGGLKDTAEEQKNEPSASDDAPCG